MAQHFISEEQVKNALRVDSLQNLSKDKCIEFLSLIPDMDKDVAAAILNQLSLFTESVAHMVAQLNETCEKILKSNDASQKEAVDAYKKILDDLSGMLKEECISFEEKQKIIDTMIDIADRISAKDSENKQFLGKVFKCIGTAVGLVSLFAIAAIVGKSESDNDAPDMNSVPDSDFPVEPYDWWGKNDG